MPPNSIKCKARRGEKFNSRAQNQSFLFDEVLHARFEALDLLYRFDVVERLADALMSMFNYFYKNIDLVKSNPGFFTPVLPGLSTAGYS